VALVDLLIAGAVLAGAVALLARSLRRSAGGCAGCHGGCGRAAAPDVVRLGRPGPRDGGR
jgi:cytochrome c553